MFPTTVSKPKTDSSLLEAIAYAEDGELIEETLKVEN
jgi:hypothetical protein